MKIESKLSNFDTKSTPSSNDINIIASNNESNPPKKHVSSLSDEVFAGAFAGFVARLLTAPFDFIKIRIQLQTSNNKYVSMLQSFREVIKEEGFKSLWKGNISATYLW